MPCWMMVGTGSGVGWFVPASSVQLDLGVGKWAAARGRVVEVERDSEVKPGRCICVGEGRTGGGGDTRWGGLVPRLESQILLR
jgi:hypothetical protein